MKDLVSMVDYVRNHPATMDYEYFCKNVLDYAYFLDKPLTLGMFIPCDLDGNVLEKPYEGMFEIKPNTKCSGWDYLHKSSDEKGDARYYDKNSYIKSRNEYNKALDRVVFDGLKDCNKQSDLPFEIDSLLFNQKNPRIEDLVSLKLKYKEQ